MQRTPNYNLLQYQTGDKFLTADLNDSFSKIDTGLSDLQETVNNASGDAVATTNEVIAARKGEASLVDKINIIDSDLVDKQTQLDAKIKNDDVYIYANNPPSSLQPILTTNDDNATVFDAIMQYAKTNKRKVKVKKGTYKLSYVNLYDGVSIEGEGKEKTIFQSVISAETSFFRTADLVVSSITLSDFSIYGGINRDNLANAGQTMLYLNSLNGGTSGNGNWYSSFNNIDIRYFDGIGIYINDAYADSMHPNQFLNFYNVNVFRNEADSRCLKINGQAAQIQFLNCNFDNTGHIAGGATISPLKNGSGKNIEIIGSNTVIFNNVTSQNSAYIASTTSSTNTTFVNCWFENSKYTITADTVTNLNVNRCHFANACLDGSTNGYGVKVINSNSSAQIENNNFVGTVDYTVQGDGNCPHIKMSGNTGSNKTKNIVKQRNTADNTFGVGMSKLIQYNCNGAIIKTLTSSFSAGETFTIYFSTAGGAVTIDNTNNIQFPYGKSSLVCNAGDTATFIKTDLGTKEYILLSYSGTIS